MTQSTDLRSGVSIVKAMTPKDISEIISQQHSKTNEVIFITLGKVGRCRHYYSCRRLCWTRSKVHNFPCFPWSSWDKKLKNSPLARKAAGSPIICIDAKFAAIIQTCNVLVHRIHCLENFALDGAKLTLRDWIGGTVALHILVITWHFEIFWRIGNGISIHFWQ